MASTKVSEVLKTVMGEGEQGVKEKEFHCRGGQATLMAKSGAQDLELG
jgi:hypothetical protein